MCQSNKSPVAECDNGTLKNAIRGFQKLFDCIKIHLNRRRSGGEKEGYWGIALGS